MLSKIFVLVPMGAILSIAALAADDPIAKPTCCAKHAYCCTIKARCCDDGKTADEEIIPLTFVKDESAKPTCCDKRAYCCTIKAPCCGKTLVTEVSTLAADNAADSKDDAANTCCAKRAYCCTIRATCCGTEAKADFVDKEITEKEALAFAAERDRALPTCCIKRAYCCTVKSPCCGRALDLEIVR